MVKHPEWATKFKTKGTELRFKNGRYYLYQVSSKWDPKIKRSRKITIKYLGKITEEEGFVESSKNMPNNKTFNLDNIYVKRFGSADFFSKHFMDFEIILKKYFPDDWKSIIVLAFIRLFYKSTLKNVEMHYVNNFISVMYPNLKLSPKNLSSFLANIGNQRINIVDFFKEFSTDNDHVLFDGTDLISHSKKMNINHFSKTKKGTFDFIDNIMFIFSVKSQKPIYYRILPGNIKDVKSFSSCLLESGINDAVVIVDKGFYSKANIEQLLKEEINFIMPLKRNSNIVEYDNLKDYATNNKCNYFMFEKRVIWHTQIIKDNQKIDLFFDEELKVRESKDYLRRIESHPDEYSFEKYQQKQHTFGTIALYNNLELPAEDIFIYYKSRNQIEVMIDAFKNILEADRSYMQNEISLEGWMFINHIVLMWYYKILQILKYNNLNKKYSPMDIVAFLETINKVKINGQWVNAEITKKNQDLLETISKPIT